MVDEVLMNVDDWWSRNIVCTLNCTLYTTVHLENVSSSSSSSVWVKKSYGRIHVGTAEWEVTETYGATGLVDNLSSNILHYSNRGAQWECELELERR